YGLPRIIWKKQSPCGGGCGNLFFPPQPVQRHAPFMSWSVGMFESAEVGNVIDKETYNEEEPKLRAALLQAQKELADANFSVLILVGGVETAGKSETVNLLMEWLDARGIQTHALGEPSDEEAERPPMWRWWRLLPAKGRIGIFFGSWYTLPI